MVLPLFDLGVVVGGSIAVVLLIAVSAFFSSSEIAIFSLEGHRIEMLVQDGKRGATVVRSLRADPHRLLITVLVGNNVANIAAASIATAVAMSLLPADRAVTVATIFTSVFVLAFGEIAPKSYGLGHNERWALRVATPISISQRIMAPVVWMFDRITRVINRITGGDRDIERLLTRADLEGLLSVGAKSGAIDREEHLMIQGIFDLSAAPARTVMIPREEIVAVDISAGLEGVRDACVGAKVSRVPVYDGQLDRVVGVADLRDVLVASEHDRTLEDVLVSAPVINEDVPLDEVLQRLQDARARIGIMTKGGNTTGMVTVEDIVEQIVGEIRVRGELHTIEHRADGSVVVSGRMTVGELVRRLNFSIDTTGGDGTIGGLVAHLANGELVEESAVGQGDWSLIPEVIVDGIVERVRIEEAPPQPFGPMDHHD